MARKKKHEGHGGAWKVAYADFVTAMMALFMVLWISSQKNEILIATSRYFQNPFTSPMPASSGVMDGKKDSIDPNDAPPGKLFTAEMYDTLAKEFLKLLDVSQDKKQKPIEIKVTSEGIVISIFNRGKQPIFDGVSTKMTEWGEYVAQNLAWVIDRFHMRVRIDAHTPKGFVPEDAGMTDWDLTVNQSNAMRTKLVFYGLDSSKVDRVSGFADTHPLKGYAKEDPINYRMELTLSATEETSVPKFK